MKVVYVIGPFRGKTAWDVERNVRSAEAMALEVAKLGAMPLCPHTNTRFFDGQLTAQFWLDGTMELLKRCDAAITVGDWHESKGSCGEVQYCLDKGIPLMQSRGALAAWLESGARTGRFNSGVNVANAPKPSVVIAEHIGTVNMGGDE